MLEHTAVFAYHSCLSLEIQAEQVHSTDQRRTEGW